MRVPGTSAIVHAGRFRNDVRRGQTNHRGFARSARWRADGARSTIRPLSSAVRTARPSAPARWGRRSVQSRQPQASTRRPPWMVSRSSQARRTPAFRFRSARRAAARRGRRSYKPAVEHELIKQIDCCQTGQVVVAGARVTVWTVAIDLLEGCGTRRWRDLDSGCPLDRVQQRQCPSVLARYTRVRPDDRPSTRPTSLRTARWVEIRGWARASSFGQIGNGQSRSARRKQQHQQPQSGIVPQGVGGCRNLFSG